MDFNDIASLVASNLSVAVIVVQGWMNLIQYRRNGELQDKMLAMAQTMIVESRELLTETNKITSANTEVMRRVLEGRG